MTTPAKIDANRRNAKRSTGPRTAKGKAVVRQNAIRHGIFATMPLIPGESFHNWEVHRQGIVASLAPAGLLEVTLAERVAILLWQIGRLLRYQTAAITADIEDAGLIPVDADPITHYLAPPGQQDDEHLKLTEQNLRVARNGFTEMLAGANLFRDLGSGDLDATLPSDLCERVMGWVFSTADEYPLVKAKPHHFTLPEFLSEVGANSTVFKEVNWTARLLLRALGYYAATTIDETAAVFRDNVQRAMDSRVAALDRQVKMLEVEPPAIIRRSENRRARAADTALLPPEQVMERTMKYEKHLTSLLNSTLHELERLQARRRGMTVVPPVVADIQVNGVVER